MPIYEYRCLKCENRFEKLVLSSASANNVDCPACQSSEVEQLFSTFYGQSRAADGSTRSLSSGCSACSASSCAGCKSH